MIPAARKISPATVHSRRRFSSVAKARKIAQVMAPKKQVVAKKLARESELNEHGKRESRDEARP